MAEIDDFFAAWGMADATDRNAAIQGSVAGDVVYADPRTDAPIQGPDALAAYVGMFTDASPGATATVVKTETIQGTARVTVAFRMGNGMEQFGQYFISPADGPIARMTGFAGTGAPE